MHRVLQIPELLLNIFSRHGPARPNDEDRKQVNRDLAALARTCRAFKEPALDILWSELQDPSPLSRCLPDISNSVTDNRHLYGPVKSYRFARPLERVEWDILCGYARRVWYMHDSGAWLHWKSIQPSVDFTPADSLFPNLRVLHCEFARQTDFLLRLPLPSLIRLHIGLPWDADSSMLQRPLASLAISSPNIKTFVFWGAQHDLTKTISGCVCSWSNLQSLSCSQAPFDVEILVHLSRIPTLTQLSFTLNDTFLAETIPSDSLPFTALDSLELRVKSLVPISRLLSWARLPSITDFDVIIDDHCSSKQELNSFLIGIQTAEMHQSVWNFRLKQEGEDLDSTLPHGMNAQSLNLNDLRPCMAFHNLRCMSLDIQRNVDLSDDGLLTLASAWPQMEELLINKDWGWHRPGGTGGITPGGLVSLLQMCPSLSVVALAIDTRGFTQWSGIGFWGPTSSLTRQFYITVIDSIIEKESVDAMARFFSANLPHAEFDFAFWESSSEADFPDLCSHYERWDKVSQKVDEAVGREPAVRFR